MENLLREAATPLLQEGEVLLLVSEVVREHHRNLLDYGIVTAALRAQQDAVNDYISACVELKELDWIVLVYRAGEYV